VTEPQTSGTEAVEPPSAAEPAVTEASSQTASTTEGGEAISPPQPIAAKDITLTHTRVDLVKFVRFTDFVPCDYNEDGIVDVLALSSRLSTGYGFTGIGNGLFTEGPSFDLPFRPAAAVPAGSSSEEINTLFLVSSVGTVSIFYPLVDDDPPMLGPSAVFSVFRLECEEGPFFAVHGENEASVRIYSLAMGGLQDEGEWPTLQSDDVETWYRQVTSWRPLADQGPFPLPPNGMERVAQLGDLNGDMILDLVYYASGKIFYKLSQDGKALAGEKAAPCSTAPAAIKLADVDGNGLLDVLALVGSSGILEVYLTEPAEEQPEE